MIDKKVIVALDFNNIDEILTFTDSISNQECRVKVGKELFTTYGPEIIQKLHAKGFEIFLDLKFHDIPNTVYKAVKAAAKLKVWMLSLHASGGSEMLKMARQAVSESESKPLLIAVTVLTSLDDNDLHEIGYKFKVKDTVEHLAKLSYNSHMDGVVCSANETISIKNVTHPDFLAITPGIRLANDNKADQKRVMTPKDAVLNKADYLVIGRSITKAKNPANTLNQINKEINNLHLII